MNSTAALIITYDSTSVTNINAAMNAKHSKMMTPDSAITTAVSRSNNEMFDRTFCANLIAKVNTSPGINSCANPEACDPASRKLFTIAVLHSVEYVSKARKKPIVMTNLISSRNISPTSALCQIRLPNVQTN